MAVYNLFVVSNPVSAIHAALLATKLAANRKNVLIIDKGKRKKSFADEIREAASGFTWDRVIDMSEFVEESTDLKPSFRKRITRKVKHLPIIRSFYNRMLKKYLDRDEQQLSNEIRGLLEEISFENDQHTLYLLTQTRINAALKNVFYNASYYYFEHGLPDYLFSVKDKSDKNKGLYCIFTDAFNQYLQKRQRKSIALDFVSTMAYETYLRNLYSNEKRIDTLKKQIPGNSIFIILQPFEKYEIDPAFWQTYIERIIQNEKSKAVSLVIKPHPLQSSETVQHLKTWLVRKSIPFIMIEDPGMTSISCEVLLVMMKDTFTSVYSPFSYSVYFLSKLYNGGSPAFYHSYGSMGKWFEKSPLQFKNQYHEHKEIIEECFSTNCKSLEINFSTE